MSAPGSPAEAPLPRPTLETSPQTAAAMIDWERFYARFREPGFVPGFEIENRLGGGAFGEVYRARKVSIDKPYAIKFLKVDGEVERQVIEREIGQARLFAAAAGVTGIFLAKLDGTARGGIVVAIREELDVPVKLVGVGERPEDVQPFDPEAFVEAMFAG